MNARRWEYRVTGVFVFRDRMAQELNRLGGQGWELVAIIDDSAYFKREIAPAGL